MTLEDWPAGLATYFGINETTAQLLLSLVVICTFLFPVMLLSRGRNAPLIWLVTIFLAECVVLGLGWLPFWIMIATVALMAVAIAFLGSKTVTGG